MASVRGGKKKDQDPDQTRQTGPNPSQQQQQQQQAGLGQQGRVSAGTGPSALWNPRTGPEAKETNKNTGAQVQQPLFAFRYLAHQQACGLRLCPQSGVVGLAMRGKVIRESRGGGTPSPSHHPRGAPRRGEKTPALGG